MNLQLDCRHYRNDKPCKFHCGCGGCAHYEPMGTRILIIKLDAIGDVARTTPILRALCEHYSPCHITWLVAPAAEEMLRGNSWIDLLLPYAAESLEPLRIMSFDVVLSLDKTPRATAVAMWTDAPEKLGFGLSEFGTVYPLTKESEYAFQLGRDDELKFRRNTRTYQDTLFECIRLPYRGEEYAIEIDQADRDHADALLKRLGVGEGDTVVGVNLGGGSAFAHKMWDAEGVLRFIAELHKQVKCKVILFGAQRERAAIETVLSERLPDVLSAGVDNSIRQFQALLGRCRVVVTGDSLGMHLAIAEKIPVVTLFGPTCAQEIEFYGRGQAMISPLACAPCYRAACAVVATCMNAIEPGPVVAAVKRWLET